MMIQVTAYPLLGGLHVHAVHAEADPNGYKWHLLYSGLATLPSWYDDDPNDALWCLAECLREQSLRRAQQSRGD